MRNPATSDNEQNISVIRSLSLILKKEEEKVDEEEEVEVASTVARVVCLLYLILIPKYHTNKYIIYLWYIYILILKLKNI